MNKQIIFKLRADSPPHLYVSKIREIVEQDGFLHPTLKKLLIILKKARAPYILLGKGKEVIVRESEFYLLDRSLDPLTGYTVTYLSKESEEQLKTTPDTYYEELKSFYFKLGYEIVSEKEIPEEKMKELIKFIKFPKKDE